MVELGSTGEIPAKRACIVCSREFADTTTVCPDDGTVLTPLVQDPLIGTVLADRYEILEIIGGGGMGTVYKARHKFMKRIVALKMLNPQTVSNALALKRFQQEAQAASALNHTNILTVFDFGLTIDGQPYLIMDYLEGTNLGVVLQESGHLCIERVLDISIQACDGLAHAHSKGVIHRDLKPGNLMLIEVDKRPDFVKIVDFGIAKMILLDADESSHLTTTGEVFGSPLYMSPEQCTGKELDGRSDIYSLGCVMYRALAGISPFTGHDLLECMYKQVNDMPASFSIACPDLCIPESMEAIVLKALEKDPSKRYQSMQELREALELLIPEYSTRTHMVRPRLTQSVAHITSESTPTPLSVVNDQVSSQQKPVSNMTSPSTDSTGTAQSQSSTMESPAGKSDSLNAISARQPNANVDTNKTNTPLGAIQSSLSPRMISNAVAFAAIALVGIAILMTAHHKSPPPANDLPSKAGISSEEDRQVDQIIKNAYAEFNKGDYSSAQRDAMSALNKAKKLGNNNPRYAQSLDLLGQVHYAEGAYDLAKADFKQALSLRDKLYGKQSTEAASTKSGLGRVYAALGQYSQAEPLLRASLATREKVLGSQDLSVADSLSGLADLALRQGKYESAVRYLTSALKVREGALGHDSPAVAASLNDLGQAYQLEKNFPEAEELYKKALTIRQAKLPANDPQIANSLICLGSLYIKTGKLSDATTLFKQALSIQEKALGVADPSVAKTRQLITRLAERTKHKAGGGAKSGFQNWLAK